MESPITFIIPNWPAPANVKSLQTTRHGGVSLPPFDDFNLAMHVQDDVLAVDKNRGLLARYLPNAPVWTNQVHGVRIINAATTKNLEDADGSFTRKKEVVCVTMTADCLPVLLCDEAGSVVAAVHAGWRGLCDGVIEAAIQRMDVPSSRIMAWLGPAIGPLAFEVGEDVRAQFIAVDAKARLAFAPQGEKWLGNLYQLAQQRLNNLGVQQVYGGGINADFCTYTDATRFFSFRRDNITGRMASLIWLAS